MVRLPAASLVVLVGPSGAGKSHWAAANFRPDQIVSSDSLRGLVGTAEHDQRAGTDAFDVLDLVLERRLARRLLTVVDTLGLDAARRARYHELASRNGLPAHVVVFDTPDDECRSRNRGRTGTVPAKVLSAQLAARGRAIEEIATEAWSAVHRPEPVEIVASELVERGTERRRLGFGLQLSSFGGEGPLAARLAETAAMAEAIGFESLWLMDHVVQIPQVGRPWEDIPESWTTLAWLAAHTTTMRLGALVTGVTLRNPAHLAKIVATVDVLSGGRVTCGLGAGWWKWEHDLFGWRFPPLVERYALLEDVLRLLPMMWGPGSPPFEGDVLSVAETLCYPRPVQEHVPILVGGSGERRTLRLAARYADACNLRGDPSTVARKVSVLAGHCADVGRDRAEVKVTHLSTACVVGSRREVTRLGHEVDRLCAGTVEDHVGRYRLLAEAGVETAIVALTDATAPGVLERFGEVISAFDRPPPG